MRENNKIAPFLKWVGGKRQLLLPLIECIPKNFNRFYEPFVGAGAVLLSLQPARAVINDSNEELINVYKVIKEKPKALVDDLKNHKNEPEYFYRLRSIDREEDYKNLSEVQRASRIIYLNKTCYNGLYRVNRAGKFNAPFGRYKNPNFVNEPTIMAVSRYLNENSIEILNEDFEVALQGIDKDDFIYFDPPYVPLTKSSNFTGYVRGGFNSGDQLRLKNLCDKLNKQGIRFLLSNSATEPIFDLYKDYQIRQIKANRIINSNSAKRGQINELLIRNYS